MIGSPQRHSHETQRTAMRQAVCLKPKWAMTFTARDPTANLLEQRAAEVVGKEAALFIPSGTMGNTIAIKLLTEHGQEVICDSRAHLLDWEVIDARLVLRLSDPVATETKDGILHGWDLIRTVLERRQALTPPAPG